MCPCGLNLPVPTFGVAVGINTPHFNRRMNSDCILSIKKWKTERHFSPKKLTAIDSSLSVLPLV